MTGRKDNSPDRRVQKTRKLLHDALISLLHEKSYDEIVVKEILDRANVGRSTFYTHFRDKDDLLVGGVQDILLSIQSARISVSGNGRDEMIWFSLPIFEHIDEHRRANRLQIGRRGRVVLHEHLQKVLVDLISRRMKSELRNRAKAMSQVPPDLLIQHVASTFILVLNWWVDRNSGLAPVQIDALFRDLVGPALATR